MTLYFATASREHVLGRARTHTMRAMRAPRNTAHMLAALAACAAGDVASHSSHAAGKGANSLELTKRMTSFFSGGVPAIGSFRTAPQKASAL